MDQYLDRLTISIRALISYQALTVVVPIFLGFAVHQRKNNAQYLNKIECVIHAFLYEEFMVVR